MASAATLGGCRPQGVVRVFRNAAGLSVKTTRVVDPKTLLGYARDNYLPPLKGPYSYERSGWRVQGLRTRAVHLIFEEGTASQISQPTLDTLREIGRLARQGKYRVEFRWWIWANGYKEDGPTLFRRLGLKP